MEQAKIEQLAFLYLCSEHDKRLLLKKEKMPLADFDRLTYLIYHFGFKEYHIKVWMEFAGEFKKEWDCLEALHETGGCVGNIGNTESEIKLHEHLKYAPYEVRMIGLADKLSNIRDIDRDYPVMGEELWNRFRMKEKNTIGWYYKGLRESLREGFEQEEAFREYSYLVDKNFGIDELSHI